VEADVEATATSEVAQSARQESLSSAIAMPSS
jgi:hypothetical protein